jgi:hypothetical protein
MKLLKEIPETSAILRDTYHLAHHQGSSSAQREERAPMPGAATVGKQNVLKPSKSHPGVPKTNPPIPGGCERTQVPGRR